LKLLFDRGGRAEARLRRHSESRARYPTAASEGDVVASVRRLPAASVTGRQSSFTRMFPLMRILAGIEEQKRRKALEGQIIDALTLMSSSLKAGYSFLQAMELAAKECPPPLGEEFRITLHEMSLGASVEDSLQELGRRAGVDDLDMVLTAVIIQRQVGGNLAEVLDTIAGTIRERIRIRGEIKTLTAQGRISGWIVGALPLAILMFVSLLNPGYMQPMFRSPFGLFFIGMGLCGQVIGALMIKKIINIEV